MNKSLLKPLLLGSSLVCLAGSPATYALAETDFSALTSPQDQEDACTYDTFFLPEADGFSQPYVGDPMPYYEDGTFYICYLKEQGDSYHHSIYLTSTDDFLSYTETDDLILEASDKDAQESWLGTGSVVKIDDQYYLFYTAHGDDASLEYKETIRVATGSTLTELTEDTSWELTPPEELGQKNDFRDPQVYYDADVNVLHMTVTAAQEGVARVLKYTLSRDLQDITYEGVLFTDPTGDFWNLECSDTFCIDGTWYLTYSGQDDTLWYAVADEPYGTYSEPRRLDGKLFYAAKHVEDGEHTYMVGWARRSDSPSGLSVTAWAGNLAVQEIKKQADDSLALYPVATVAESFTQVQEPADSQSEYVLSAGEAAAYHEVFSCEETYMLTGAFRYTGEGCFGLAFDYDGRREKYKRLEIRPSENNMALTFGEGAIEVTNTAVALTPDETYPFTYIQDGSVGIFYIDGQAALTLRLYGVSGKPISLFAENCEVTFTELKQLTK